MGKLAHKEVGEIFVGKTFVGDGNKQAQWGFWITFPKLRANSDKAELLFLKELA